MFANSDGMTPDRLLKLKSLQPTEQKKSSYLGEYWMNLKVAYWLSVFIVIIVSQSYSHLGCLQIW